MFLAGDSVKRLEEIFCVQKSTIRRIITIYLKINRTERKAKGGIRRQILNLEQKYNILDWVKEDYGMP